jgi:hypothetical protein
MKIPAASWGIEPVIFRLVAQFFNQLRYRMPLLLTVGLFKRTFCGCVVTGCSNSLSVNNIEIEVRYTKYVYGDLSEN